MRLYSEIDVDIDRSFGLPDVPTLPQGHESPADRDAFLKPYRDKYKNKRNPQMFGDANWGTRMAWEDDANGRQSVDFPWITFCVWIKWVCLLGAVRAQFEKPRTFTRGLIDLPDQIIKDFKGKKPGDKIFWASLSSTTDDPQISKNFSDQHKPVEKNAIFTIRNVYEGIEVLHVSQYPSERETLLPPFSLLEVVDVASGDGKPVEMTCNYIGCQMTEAFRHEIEKDLKEACNALDKATREKKSEAKANRSTHATKRSGGSS
jgi:hypothetical protein